MQKLKEEKSEKDRITRLVLSVLLDDSMTNDDAMRRCAVFHAQQHRAHHVCFSHDWRVVSHNVILHTLHVPYERAAQRVSESSVMSSIKSQEELLTAVRG
jgi:hypothetical protein